MLCTASDEELKNFDWNLFDDDEDDFDDLEDDEDFEIDDEEFEDEDDDFDFEDDDDDDDLDDDDEYNHDRGRLTFLTEPTVFDDDEAVLIDRHLKSMDRVRHARELY